jgi:plasmid stabilization system protein ParE
LYELSFKEQVAEDAALAYSWYEPRATGLGEEFLRLFYAAAKDILRNPLLYPVVHRDFRRRLLRRFPYAMYYRIEDDRVIVCGVFHCARDPSYVGNTLADR